MEFRFRTQRGAMEKQKEYQALCVLFYRCVSAEKCNNVWVGAEVRKKSSVRLELAAHLGIGSGAESRD